MMRKHGVENVNEHFLSFNTICDATQVSLVGFTEVSRMSILGSKMCLVLYVLLLQCTCAYLWYYQLNSYPLLPSLSTPVPILYNKFTNLCMLISYTFSCHLCVL